jgi:hypothetical protein
MEALLRVLACPRSAGGAAAAAAGAGAAAGVHEEAMQAVGAVALGVGRQFGKYMPSFYPYLKAGLINHQEWQVGCAGFGEQGLVLRTRDGWAGGGRAAAFCN